ncbi:hypothetical protein E5S67_05608 [Microcoleus sp. IPMA8]|uniref:Uncharacterized protein n=1 Tax=Microcoleus asticus IPMA8 TaxID=2563858 RepID=A0ABX2D5A3_9CYAN|nr:hypothetical protein [Microcoleus asticus IPMA8]
MLSLTGNLWSSDSRSNLSRASLGVKDDFLEHIPLSSLYRDLRIIAQICVGFYKRWRQQPWKLSESDR